ncbi:hypothetical protein JW968_07295 [Candidatus Woesearchaeota archaeon]|nr:hypothetical protein [Candidatus Woesearchaeota archaeon]
MAKEAKYLDIPLSTTLKFYKREDIRQEMLRSSRSREVAIKYGSKGFGKRPDILQYPNDILEAARQGATSFHVSEEIWSSPLQLQPSMKKADIDKLRSGWDLVLDIDCKFLDYSRIAADLLVKALSHHGISSISCKFSGNHGFHIGVPFGSFPDNVHGRETKLLFPDGAQQIALYLKEMIRKPLAERILAADSIDSISETTGISFSDLVGRSSGKPEFDPFRILDIDTVLISSRHLYRMPYSINEKSGLVSIPIDPKRILDFDKDSARPDVVEVSGFRFLDSVHSEQNETKSLFVQAFDFHVKETLKRQKEVRKMQHFADDLKIALDESFFPPCIQRIHKGLDDGKKRAVFILMNYLTSIGWDYAKIEAYMREWNMRNPEPLRENIWLGQLRYHMSRKKSILPPNCDNMMYMKGIGVCFPDNLCQKIKNPAQYSLRKARHLKPSKPKKDKKKPAESAE